MGAITPFDSTNFLDSDEYPSIIVDNSVTKHKYLEAYEELKFSSNVLKAIYSDPDQKGHRPNRLRAITLRLITAKMDNLMAQARMSSGITKCFILGILHKLKLDSCSNPQAIIVCPTTEMAQELNATLANLGRFESLLRSQVVAIGADFSSKSHVIAGTPAAIHNLMVTKKINPFSIKMTVLVAADEIAEVPQVHQAATNLMHLIDADYCQILYSYSTWTNKVHTFFSGSLQRFGKWNKMWVNSEEYSVFYSHMHKVVVPGDDYTKAAALAKILRLLSSEEQVIVYVNPGSSTEILRPELNNLDVVFAPNPEKRGKEDPVTRFKSCEAKILVTSIPLVTGYRETSFDLSQVKFVIFFDIPVARVGVLDFECYYRLATRAGINCYNRQGCVLHLLSEDSQPSQRLMDQVEARTGRVAMRHKHEGCDDMQKIIKNLECCLPTTR